MNTGRTSATLRRKSESSVCVKVATGFMQFIPILNGDVIRGMPIRQAVYAGLVLLRSSLDAMLHVKTGHVAFVLMRQFAQPTNVFHSQISEKTTQYFVH